MQYKYNPGFYSDEEIMSSFVARKGILSALLSTIRENTGGSNRHVLVVGPRGIGKTTLVRRVAAEVRSSEELSARWLPVQFAEESYQVATPGEFWLEALARLGDQEGQSGFLKVVEELRGERDEVRLRGRALGQILDYTRRAQKRALLIVENLDMIIGNMLEEHADCDLRRALVNEPNIMLLGTATTAFTEVKKIDRAWFQLFSVFELPPLSQEECGALWKDVTRGTPSPSQLRPIEILTGGNPRLLKILADFAVRASFRELMDNLVKLIDDHTEYFKSQLDRLASVERKVFATLLDIWDPSDARTIAGRGRMNVSKVSALLNRLVNRGAVVMVSSKGRRQSYQATERLFNIYYLMRRQGSPSDRVRAAVRFMVDFYEDRELVLTLTKLAQEACLLEPKLRRDHYLAYEEVVKQIGEVRLRSAIAKATPKEFFTAEDVPESVRLLATAASEHAEVDEMRAVLKRAGQLEKEGRLVEAEQAYRQALESDPKSSRIWGALGGLLAKSPSRAVEAEVALRKAIQSNSKDPWPYFRLGGLLSGFEDRYEESEKSYRKSIELMPDFAWPWVKLGDVLSRRSERYEEAEQAFKRATEVEPENCWAWVLLGNFYGEKLGRFDDAERAYRHAIESDPKFIFAWLHLGKVLERDARRLEEANSVYRNATELEPKNTSAWAYLGEFLDTKMSRFEEAAQVCRKLLELEPNSAHFWRLYGFLNEMKLRQFVEAEQAYRRALELDPKSVHTLTHLAQLLLKEKKRQEAGAFIREAVGLEPNNVWSWSVLADFLSEAVETYAESERAYQRALELNPNASYVWAKLGDLLYEKLDRFEDAIVAYRKAVELEPKQEMAWILLGEVLQEKLGRQEEAEEVLKKGVEANPNSAHLLVHLGLTLQANPGKRADAEALLKTAVEMEPNYSGAWRILGDLLSGYTNRAKDAEDAYFRAIELEGHDSKAWLSLYKLRLFSKQNPDRTIEEVDEFLNRTGRRAEDLNFVAWCIFSSGLEGFLPIAERLARESLAVREETRESWPVVHTLVSILSARGKWEEALDLAPSMIAAAITEEGALRHGTDFILSAAAAGFAAKALVIVKDSTARKAFEPLEIGLQIYLGEEPQAAKEIVEVGRDVADRIRQKRLSVQEDSLSSKLVPHPAGAAS